MSIRLLTPYPRFPFRQELAASPFPVPVELNTTAYLGDIYEIKHLDTSNMASFVTDFAFGAAVARAQLYLYYSLLSQAAPSITWGLGDTWAAGIHAWPQFKHAPENTVLVTATSYPVYDGVILYDFLPQSEVVAALGAAAVASGIAWAVYPQLAIYKATALAKLGTAADMLDQAIADLSGTLLAMMGV